MARAARAAPWADTLEWTLPSSRLYNLTEDQGVKRMLAFMIARDTMHQNQWLAAVEELKADGLEETPAPSNFPQELEDSRASYTYWNCSEGTESAEGRWAQGPTPDGKGSSSIWPTRVR